MFRASSDMRACVCIYIILSFIAGLLINKVGVPDNNVVAIT